MEEQNPSVTEFNKQLKAAAPELFAALQRIALALPSDDNYDAAKAVIRLQAIARFAIEKVNK